MKSAVNSKEGTQQGTATTCRHQAITERCGAAGAQNHNSAAQEELTDNEHAVNRQQSTEETQNNKTAQTRCNNFQNGVAQPKPTDNTTQQEPTDHKQEVSR